MSEILEVLRPGGPGRRPSGCGGQAPLLRLRCARCGRVYRSRCWPSYAKKLQACVACRPGPTHAACVAGGRARLGWRKGQAE